jgi:uncharacterized membrane protein YiaA
LTSENCCILEALPLAHVSEHACECRGIQREVVVVVVAVGVAAATVAVAVAVATAVAVAVAVAGAVAVASLGICTSGNEFIYHL